MEEKRNLIIKAAINIFVEKGYKKTTVDEIAANVGMSKSNLYNYFKTKEEIFKATKLPAKIKHKNPFSDAKRSGIIEGALEIFGQKGYSKTIMEDIAKNLGYTTAYIYQYFPSKMELYRAIVSEMSMEITTRLFKDFSEKDYKDNYRKSAKSLLKILAEPKWTGFFRMLVADGENYPELIDIFGKQLFNNHTVIFIKDLQKKGIFRDMDPLLMQRVFWGAVMGFFFEQYLLKRQPFFENEQFVDGLLDIFFLGVSCDQEPKHQLKDHLQSNEVYKHRKIKE
ncbi:TetR/AcrR family transcriptional regulator [Desulfosporosinus metallidurans]|uniref:Transcriptional regulator, TetR family n=1 Tax=Desulfosporosinus metallidurans TaxID=1888891 RepID=A0A1Q8QD41_9FIRM|nr:TetR/AcrR family transcriptional regulator [Desulfosporosinus metallidurans]OLN25260.1 Transcriptional regulator, TetR family [Desulfosporosinus metallidurans]